MRIVFTHDFRGVWTKELFYRAGTEYEIDDEGGAELIALGHAVALEPVAYVQTVVVPVVNVPDDEPEPVGPPTDAPPVVEPEPEQKSRRGKHGHSTD